MLILSIPFINKEIVTEKAEKYPNYCKEFRLDYSNGLDQFPIEIIDSKTIITIRNIKEGGINNFNFEEKLKFYKQIIEQTNCLCDLEISEINEQNISAIPASNLILSYHDFSENANFAKLEEIINKSNSIDSVYLKIAVNVNKYSELLEIPKMISLSNKPVIFAGMGKLGKISRILYKHLGAEATFIGLPENPTAKGQLYVQEAELYNLSSKSNKTKIGGIIGGEQVEHSLGIEYYNDLFKQKKLDAVYLPLVTDNLEDLWNWIHKADLDCYGFSITMPFKKMIDKKEKIPIVNLFLPKTGRMLNTDLTALQRSIEFLKVKPEENILIFGSGATAETALNAFSDFNVIALTGRNEVAGKRLAKKYKREFVKLQNSDDHKYNLIINCTPIGMNDEDFMTETGIKNFQKVIDLPYREYDTELIKYCKKEAIPFIDGKQFWQWQAAKQQEEFLKEINK